jgi:hypothetical protein
MQNLGLCSVLRAFEQGSRDLHRATPAVTRGLDFSGFIRRTALFYRLLRHTRWCGESILIRILTGPIQSSFTTHKGVWRTYSKPDPHGLNTIDIYNENIHVHAKYWSCSESNTRNSYLWCIYHASIRHAYLHSPSIMMHIRHELTYANKFSSCLYLKD